MQVFHQKKLAVLLLCVVGCKAPLDFGGDTESKALTYAEYVADGGDAWFDPVGASDIYSRCFSTRDGYDAWWRFAISADDGDELVAAVARKENGPKQVEWNARTEYPATWKPDDTPPQWWTRSAGADAKSVYWCHTAGAAERHHGWYFLYDPKSELMYGWHWNHQWSCGECTTPLAVEQPEPAIDSESPIEQESDE